MHGILESSTTRGRFYAFMYGVIAHTRACQVLLNSRNCAELLYSQTEAISKLKKEMRNTGRACTDDNVLAVVCCSDISAVERTKSPSQAPLRSMQMLLDLYGALDTVVVHAEGLAKLVAVRGGLSKLEIEGLAAIIS